MKAVREEDFDEEMNNPLNGIGSFVLSYEDDIDMVQLKIQFNLLSNILNMEVFVSCGEGQVDESSKTNDYKSSCKVNQTHTLGTCYEHIK